MVKALQIRGMKRRDFLRLTAVGGVSALTASALASELDMTAPRRIRRVKPFALEELSIVQLQRLIESRKASAVSLVKQYVARIEAIDRRGPRLNAVIELNPDAAGIAAELD